MTARSTARSVSTISNRVCALNGVGGADCKHNVICGRNHRESFRASSTATLYEGRWRLTGSSTRRDYLQRFQRTRPRGNMGEAVGCARFDSFLVCPLRKRELPQGVGRLHDEARQAFTRRYGVHHTASSRQRGHYVFSRAQVHLFCVLWEAITSALGRIASEK